ncbi:hypothetical protein STCU_09099 [Strigomonas culicis]|uniref:Uncharacterized protein n=1 Tax=Strigomonas culicis TaxID=28005 RepID=S9TUK4_9TRYP|nr:hypothetical protein STCU_09099 [Strigomonas culicis]|eukprot:EPY20228.1 hypothetical protein STCU_09099 [Strigomonas culicis]
MEDADLRNTPRDVRLREYNEFLAQLEEMLQLLDDADDLQDEGEATLREAEEKITALASSLNAEEQVQLTPGLAMDRATRAPQWTAQAPYEVHFDGKRWYPCVVTARVAPESTLHRQQYRAVILGYADQVEEVLYEELRPWQAAASPEALRSGAGCHAIHPERHLYAPATVERLALNGNVVVSFTGAEGAREEREVCLSHVMPGDLKCYAALKKQPKRSAEELKAERLHAKRERAEEKRLMKADKIAQDANDWQDLMSDMGFDPPKKKKKF